MKKNILFTGFILPFSLLILFAGFSGNDLKYPNGAPAGYTGSPADNKNCSLASCHGGTATSVTGWITSDIPVDGYTPGYAYTITVTVTGSGAKGFEASPQALNGTLLGTLAAGTGTKLVGGNKYVTQTTSSNSNPRVWTFTWTAPVAGTGSVTFYGAFTVNKPVTKLSTLVVTEKVNTSVAEIEDFSFTLYPNPTRDHLSFSYRLRETQTVKIELLSSTGSIVKFLTFENQAPGEQTQSIDINGTVPSGIYFTRFRAGSSIITKKLIIL